MAEVPEILAGLPDILTERETSRAIRLAPSTLRNARHHRKLLPFIRVGRSVRYRKSDIVAYLDANRVEPEA